MATLALQLACPNCATRLRVRDKSFAGRTVNCPDCRWQITIQLAATGELTAVNAGPPVPTAQPPVSEPATAAPRRRTAVIVATSLIVLLGCGAVLVIVLRSGESSSEPQVAESPAANAPPVVTAPEAPSDDAAQPPEVSGANTPAQPEVTAGPSTEPPRPVVEPTPPTAPATGPDAEPITVALAADEPVFDINAVLSQPLVEFTQATPRPAAEVLKVVGELSGLALDTTQLDAAAASRLEKPITLALHNTSVRGVLDATVEAAGLTYSLGNGTVVVIDRGTEPR